MKNLLISASLVVAIPLGGCATNQNAASRTVTGAGIGAAAGAAAGAALGGGVLTGAVTGAVLGGAAGALIKGPVIGGRQYYRDSKGYCYYVDRDGKPIYSPEARCD